LQRLCALRDNARYHEIIDEKLQTGRKFMNERVSWRRPWMVVAALVCIYMLSQFLRNSIAVIAPDLSRQFDLDAAGLGLLSSVFFLSFAAAQIPLGAAIDRYGPKAPMIATGLLAIGAVFLFAQARTGAQLKGARLLLGVGCCSFFMAPLALYAGLYSREKFSTIASVHLGGGSIGMLMATAPLAYGAAAFGWRSVFLWTGAFAALATLGLILFAYEAPQARAARQARSESWGEIARGVVEATRVKGFWRLFFMQAATSSAFATVLGLWVGPWLAHVYGLDLEARGRFTLALAASQIAAVFCWGPMDRVFGSYRTPVLLGVSASVIAMIIASTIDIPLAMMPWFLAFYGAALGLFPVLIAQGKSLFPERLTGRGLTLLNMGTMSGTFVQQYITGLAIEAFGAKIVDGARVYPAAAYKLVFALLAIQLTIATFFYLKVPDPRRDFESSL
jgi:MFS family permease